MEVFLEIYLLGTMGITVGIPILEHDKKTVTDLTSFTNMYIEGRNL